LGRVVAGLIFCCGGAGVGRHLLQKGGHFRRRRGVRLVKEGDDVEGFALITSVSMPNMTNICIG
jgi:hypothetical protein